MLVTDYHIRDYREAGYCLVEGLIPTDLMDAARTRILEIADDLNGRKEEWEV